MITDYFSFGFKNLRRRGIRSWLTLLGIIIGIAAVVSLISLGDGLKTAVTSQFGLSSTNVIIIQAGGLNSFGPPGSGVVNPLTQGDADAIEKIGNVEIAIARIIETIKIEFNNKLIIGNVYSIEEGTKRQYDYDAQGIEILSGRLLDDGDTNKVVLGNNFLNKDKNGFGKAISAGDKITINNKSFQVAGILKKKGSFYLDQSIAMNKNSLKELTGNGEDVDAISAIVENKDYIERTKEDIIKLLRQRRDVNKGEEDFEVQTPDAILETVNNVLGGIQTFIVVIAFMSIIVGLIGIINTMTTSVVERQKEIGIMKAIGAKNSDIFLQFFIESGLFGLIGGIIGIILGVNMGFFGTILINNFLGSTSTPSIDLYLILFSLIGAFVIGSIAGVFPAMKAAKQRPVDSIRK